MLLESFGSYSAKENFLVPEGSLEPIELSDCQKVLVFTLLIAYIYVTIYTAVKYPIGGNVLLSVLLAIFFSLLFWFVKLLEVMFIGLKGANKKRKARKKARKARKKGPIY